MVLDKVEYYECDYKEVNKFIRNELGLKSYNFQQDMESSNDTSHTMRLKKEELEQDEIEEIESYIKQNECGFGDYMSYRLFDYLCYKGKIEPGNYLINVCW